MSKTSKWACPGCHKAIAWLTRSRFTKVGVVPVAAPCPHCGALLTLPVAPWKKMWVGIFVFAVPGWIESLTYGGIRYSYLVLPLTLWLVWSNQRHIHLMLASPEPARGDSAQEDSQGGKQRRKRRKR